MLLIVAGIVPVVTGQLDDLETFARFESDRGDYIGQGLYQTFPVVTSNLPICV